MKMEKAELAYWYWVVRNWMEDQEDWRYPEEAVKGLLEGTHNQDYISDAIEYPVLRWRQLRDQIAGKFDAT